MGFNEKTAHAVLEKIESMTQIWSVALTAEQSKEHSFGRIRNQNEIVKLWSVPRTTGELLNF